jgi:hypothetical protein
MLVARLAGLSVLDAHHAGVSARTQSGACAAVSSEGTSGERSY